jgi:preprotein translocase SecE subunit
VAQAADGKRKPRIRKTAPTVRERMESAQSEPETHKKRRVLSAIAKPLTKVRFPKNRLTRVLVRILRLILTGIGWLVPKYFINSWREVRQVTWPSRRETWRLTTAVFVFAIVFGALVAGVDKGLDEIFKKVILK